MGGCICVSSPLHVNPRCLSFCLVVHHNSPVHTCLNIFMYYYIKILREGV